MTQLNQSETLLLLSEGEERDLIFWQEHGSNDELIQAHAELLDLYNADPTLIEITFDGVTFEAIGDRPPRPIKND